MNIELQRELWEDVGSVSIANGLEQIVDFMQSINAMKIQKEAMSSPESLRKNTKEYFCRLILQEWIFLKKGRKGLKSAI